MDAAQHHPDGDPMNEPNPMDAAVVALLFQSLIETLPRIVREPGLPPRALMIVPGQHWGDGRARAILGTETPLPDEDVAGIVTDLATKDIDSATGAPPALAEDAL